MKKFLLFFFILIFIFLFYLYYFNLDVRNDLKNKIVNHFSKEQLKKRKINLYATGSGSSKVKNKFNLLILKFSTKEELDINTGRKFLIEIANDFIEHINNNKNFEKYLYRTPFEIEDLELSLLVLDNNGKRREYSEEDYQKKKVSYISLGNGVIFYYLRRKNDSSLEVIYKEKLSEAIKILNNEKTD